MENKNSVTNTVKKKGRELLWIDIPNDYYIKRFSLEHCGRCYTFNPSEDPVTDIYRRIYNAYRKGHETDIYFVPNGTETEHTGIFESDMEDALTEIEQRYNN